MSTISSRTRSEHGFLTENPLSPFPSSCLLTVTDEFLEVSRGGVQVMSPLCVYICVLV